MLVLGPGKLSEVGAALGKTIRQFRKATSDVQEATSLNPTPSIPAASSAVPVAPVAAPAADTAETTPTTSESSPVSGPTAPAS